MGGNDRILKQLQEIVGAEYATNDEALMYPYSYDLTWNDPHMPDYVVLPKTVEQIQRILRLANKERIPVVPYVTGTNIGGLCIPEEGGILMDLKRMDQILEINTETGYAIIEPGVSHAKFSAALKKIWLRIRLGSASSQRIGFGYGDKPWYWAFEW